MGNYNFNINQDVMSQIEINLNLIFKDKKYLSECYNGKKKDDISPRLNTQNQIIPLKTIINMNNSIETNNIKNFFKITESNISKEKLNIYPYCLIGNLLINLYQEKNILQSFIYNCFIISPNLIMTLSNNLNNLNTYIKIAITTKLTNLKIKIENFEIDDKFAFISFDEPCFKSWLGITFLNDNEKENKILTLTTNFGMNNGIPFINSTEIPFKNPDILIKEYENINDENIKKLFSNIPGSPIYYDENKLEKVYVVGFVDIDKHFKFFNENDIKLIIKYIWKNGLKIMDKFSLNPFNNCIKLYFPNKNLTSKNIEVLTRNELKNLKYLNLKENHLGNKIIEILKKSKLWNLEKLDLSGNDIDDNGLIDFCKCYFYNIIYFSIANNKITSIGLKIFLNKSPFKHEIKELNLSKNQLCNSGIKEIKKCKKLESLEILELNNVGLTDYDLYYLTKISYPQLKFISLFENLFSFYIEDEILPLFKNKNFIIKIGSNINYEDKISFSELTLNKKYINKKYDDPLYFSYFLYKEKYKRKKFECSIYIFEEIINEDLLITSEEEKMNHFFESSIFVLHCEFQNNAFDYNCFAIYPNCIITLTRNLKKHGEFAKKISINGIECSIMNMVHKINGLTFIYFEFYIFKKFFGLNNISKDEIKKKKILIQTCYRKSNSEKPNIIKKFNIELQNNIKLNNNIYNGCPVFYKDSRNRIYAIGIISKNERLILFNDKDIEIFSYIIALFTKNNLENKNKKFVGWYYENIEKNFIDKINNNNLLCSIKTFYIEKSTVLINELFKIDFKNLISLHLCYIELNDESIKDLNLIKAQQLKELYLDGNKITKIGLLNFSKTNIINQISILSLSNNINIKDEGILAFVKSKELLNLNTIYINNIGITDSSIRYIFENVKNIKFIDARKNTITSEVLIECKHCINLFKIDPIQKKPIRKYINLKDNDLNSILKRNLNLFKRKKIQQNLETIEKNREINYFKPSDCIGKVYIKFSNEKIFKEHICVVINSNTILTLAKYIYSEKNEMANDIMISFYPERLLRFCVFKRNNFVIICFNSFFMEKWIGLKYNNETKNNFFTYEYENDFSNLHLISFFKNKIDFNQNKICNSMPIIYEENSKNYCIGFIYDNKEYYFNEKDIHFIIYNIYLYKLSIQKFNLIDLDLENYLKELILSNMNISIKELKKFSRLNLINLEKLDLSKNNIEPGGIFYLTLMEFPNLINLNLSDNKIGNEGIKLISLFMTPKLKILNLQNCKIDINGINFIFIKTNLNKSLEQLFLKGNDLQSNNLIMLKKCNIIPTLNYIDIIDND